MTSSWVPLVSHRRSTVLQVQHHHLCLLLTTLDIQAHGSLSAPADSSIHIRLSCVPPGLTVLGTRVTVLTLNQALEQLLVFVGTREFVLPGMRSDRHNSSN